MSKFNCYISDFQEPEYDIEKEICGQLISFKRGSGREFLNMEDCDSLHVWHYPIKKKELDKLPNLKLIVRMGVGFESIDIKECNRRNIIVAIVPDYGTNEVANLAIGHILNINRNITKQTEDFINNNRWNTFEYSDNIRLEYKNLGIVGMGRIGSAVAQRAKAFGMTIYFYDPYLRDGMDKVFMANRVDSLEELVSLSDIVTIHTPLTPITEKMFNKNIFKKMKDNTILINTARGKIVDSSHLVEAIESGKLSGFGFDVFPTEPPNSDDPFIKYIREKENKNFRYSITHHAGFYTKEALLELRKKATLETFRFFNGKKLKNPINLEVNNDNKT